MTLKPVNQIINAVLTPFSNYTSNPSRLERDIQRLGQAQLTQQDWSTLRTGLSTARRWFFVPSNVRNSFQSLSVEKVRTIVDGILTHALEEDVSATLNQFLQVLNTRQLQELAGLDTDEKLQLEIRIKAHLKDEALIGLFSKRSQTLWKECWPEAKGFIYYILELAVSLSGVDDLAPERSGRHNQVSSGEAQYRLKMYMDFILYPATLFGLVMTYVKNVPTALAITAMTLTSAIAFISIYKRFLRPCPQTCYGLENLLIDQNKTQNPNYFRLSIFREMDKAFASNKGVLLIGDAGVGKTSIMQGYVRRIRQGKGSALSSKIQFFSGNAETYKGYEGFAYLREKFKFWSKEAGFFIDEFHTIVQNDDEVGNKSTAFKTFADVFPIIAGATTYKEYKEFLEGNETIERRLIPIFVNQMEPEDIIPALYHFLHCKQPELDITSDVIEKIYNEAPRFKPVTSRIDAAIALLSLAISKVTDQTFPDLQNELDKYQMDLDALKQRMLHTGSHSSQDEEDLARLETKINELRSTLETKKAQGEKIRKIERVYLALKQKSYQLAPQANDPSRRKAWLANEAALKEYDRLIRVERVKAGLAPSLNAQLIEEIMAEIPLEAR